MNVFDATSSTKIESRSINIIWLVTNGILHSRKKVATFSKTVAEDGSHENLGVARPSFFTTPVLHTTPPSQNV